MRDKIITPEEAFEATIEKKQIAFSAREIAKQEDKPIEWLVNELIPVGGNILLSSPPKQAKSFLTLDLCCRLTEGKGLWLHAIPIRKCRVLYIDAENMQTMIKDRWRALSFDVEGSGADNLMMITKKSFNVSKMDIMDSKIYQEIKSEIDRYELTEYDLIVFDTLVRFHSLNENSSGDMANVMAQIQSLSPASKLILHHTNRPGQNGKINPRGSGDIEGSSDGNLELTTEVQFLSGNQKIKTSVLTLKGARCTEDIPPINIDWLGDIAHVDFKQRIDTEEKENYDTMKVAKYISTVGNKVSYEELQRKYKFDKKYIKHIVARILQYYKGKFVQTCINSEKFVEYVK